MNKISYLGFLGEFSVAETSLSERALYGPYRLVGVNVFYGFYTHGKKEKHPTKLGKS